MSDSITFTADDEPYLGLNSLTAFDHLLMESLYLNAEAARVIHNNGLNRLQKAAAQILPQGFNIALSIRELIRQGHLFAAVVLMRSLIERVGIIAYLVNVPSAIDKWEDGWRHGEKPSLSEMLRTLSGGKELKSVNQTVDTFDHLVQGDPMGTEFNLVQLDADSLGHGVGRVTTNVRLCDFLCYQTISWLTVLSGMISVVFPEISEPVTRTH